MIDRRGVFDCFMCKLLGLIRMTLLPTEQVRALRNQNEYSSILLDKLSMKNKHRTERFANQLQQALANKHAELSGDCENDASPAEPCERKSMKPADRKERYG